MPSKYELQN